MPGEAEKRGPEGRAGSVPGLRTAVLSRGRARGGGWQNDTGGLRREALLKHIYRWGAALLHCGGFKTCS